MDDTPPAKRIPKPWFWQRSFLPFFCRRKKGSRRRHKNRGAGGTDAPVRPAPAAQHYVGRGPRAPPHAAFPGRDDVGIVSYETMTRNVAHNTADAKCIPAASGQRGPA